MITGYDLLIMVFMFMGIGYMYAGLKVMNRIYEIDKAVFQQIKDEDRKWWNDLLDEFKTKTTEQKIDELKKQIEEIENE